MQLSEIGSQIVLLENALSERLSRPRIDLLPFSGWLGSMRPRHDPTDIRDYLDQGQIGVWEYARRNPVGFANTPVFSALRIVSDHVARTHLAIGSLLWNFVLQTERARSLLARMFGRGALIDYDRIVLPHRAAGYDRADLLMLIDGYSFAEPTVIPITALLPPFRLQIVFQLMTPDPFEFLDIDNEFETWKQNKRNDLAQLRTSDSDSAEQDSAFQQRLLESLDSMSGSDFIFPCVLSQPASLLVMSRPSMKLTSWVPPSALPVQVVEQPGLSTAGVVSIDAAGRSGVTACLHGMVPKSVDIEDMFNEVGAACVVGKQVLVGGHPGVICAASLRTDSVFIQMDDPSPLIQRQPSRPLRTAPRNYEQVTFNGAVSGEMQGVITGIDDGIPFISKGAACSVYTDAITNPGDSGAALIDSDNNVVGFCHSRTGIGQRVEFARWIWADHVYSSLKLQE